MGFIRACLVKYRTDRTEYMNFNENITTEKNEAEAMRRPAADYMHRSTNYLTETN